MTNEQIIMNTSIELMKAGAIKGTGKYVELIMSDGSSTTIEIPEPIHTFGAWKEIGYKVKKGEHAVAKIRIWKHSARERNESELTGNAIIDSEPVSSMFMKDAWFFTASQVEKAN